MDMDSFERDYREERRKALRDQYLSGDRSFLGTLARHGANRLEERVRDVSSGISSLFRDPESSIRSADAGLEDLYDSISSGDGTSAMMLASGLAGGGAGFNLLRGGGYSPNVVGSSGGNIVRGYHSTRADFDEFDTEKALPSGNFGLATYFSEGRKYPEGLNPGARVIEADLDTSNFLRGDKRLPIPEERVAGTLSVLRGLEDASGRGVKVDFDNDSNTAQVQYYRYRRSGEPGPVMETKTIDFNNSAQVLDDLKSLTWGLRLESMASDRRNLSDLLRGAGFTGVKGGSKDDFHIGVLDTGIIDRKYAAGGLVSGPRSTGLGSLKREYL